ncbi:hypothetical protein F4810DRAFT_682826 [Camillea tinctor]|nr:hypothetical protein F4810DRAFT_682826 [Camillea tinctor]
MTDPVSLAGLGLAVASLGLQLSDGIKTYIDAVRCRGEEIASVRQQNEALIGVLQLIGGSFLQQYSNRPVSDVVRTCLNLCETRLGDLQTLVTELTSVRRVDDGLKERLKDQRKLIVYPFKRSKLQQLEDKLSRANEALQLALQAFRIDMSLCDVKKLTSIDDCANRISAELQIVKSKVTGISQPISQMQDSLPTIQRTAESLVPLISVETEKLGKRVLEGVEILGGEVRDVRDSIQLPLRVHQEQLSRIELQTATYSERLDRLERLIVGSTKDGEVTPERVVRRLIAKPANLREICDSFLDQAATATIKKPQQVPRSLMRFVCTCRPQQSVEFSYFFRGWLDVYNKGIWTQHIPGCPLSPTKTTSQRQLAMRCTRLATLLGSAIEITFTWSSGSGGFGLGQNFTYYPTVDGNIAPAFRIAKSLRGFIHFVINEGARTSLVKDSIIRIVKLIRDGRASPLAVDRGNRTIAHHLAAEIYIIGIQYPAVGLDILRTLINLGVPMNSYDCRGNTPFHDLTYPFNETWSIPAADLVFQSTNEMVLLKHSQSHNWMMNVVYEIGFYSQCPDLAEAYGCGPLSLAVSAKDKDQVEKLLRRPNVLDECNSLGQSPLHLAASEPACLELLVRAASPAQINIADEYFLSPVETAMIMSSEKCVNGRQNIRCSGCSCADCVMILLGADCAVPVTRNLRDVLKYSSEACRNIYISAFKDRRMRLKRLALSYLSYSDIDSLELRNENVLDAYCFQVIQLLRQQNIEIPDSLMVADRLLLPQYTSIYYHTVWSCHDADRFFKIGFRDINGPHKELFDTKKDLEYQNYTNYFFWLAAHGADIHRPLTWTRNRTDWPPDTRRYGFTNAHSICFWLGHSLLYKHSPGDNPSMQRSTYLYATQEPHPLISKIIPLAISPNVADHCRCPCSAGGCTAFIYMLKGILAFVSHGKCDPHNITEIVSLYLMDFWSELSPHHYGAAIRYLTFSALEISHTCCRPSLFGYPEYLTDAEIDEIQDEEKHVLDVFAKLLQDFELKVSALALSKPDGPEEFIEFLKDYWLKRTTEVLDSINGDDLCEEERQASRQLGIIWNDDDDDNDGDGDDDDDDNSQSSDASYNPYHRVILDYWYAKLDIVRGSAA